MINLTGKNCVVTGANRGIGASISHKLSSLGAHVLGIDINNDTSKVPILCVDITNKEEVKNAVADLKDQINCVDVLVNCAGITKTSKSDLYTLEDWSATMSVNLDGPFLFTSEIFPLLKLSNGASIINITSLNSSLGFPNNPAYVASKTGLLGLSRAWSVDWGKYNIRSNCVSPGYIKTKMTEISWKNNEHREKRAARTCLGRWGEAEDVSNTVAFLASDISSYITGQMINVDGGWTIKGL